MPPGLIRTLPWSLPLALVVLWEIVCRVFAIQQFILPAPSAIVATTIEFYGAIAQHALQTLFTTIVGFAIAVVSDCCSASRSAPRSPSTTRCIR
jgi:NitT/TauT family transport system permease protein